MQTKNAMTTSKQSTSKERNVKPIFISTAHYNIVAQLARQSRRSKKAQTELMIEEAAGTVRQAQANSEQ